MIDCARAAFAATFSIEEVQALARVLYAKAMEGNLTAAKMILPYILGKPGAAPKVEEAPQEEPVLPIVLASTSVAESEAGASSPACPVANGKLEHSPPRETTLASDKSVPTAVENRERLLDRLPRPDSNGQDVPKKRLADAGHFAHSLGDDNDRTVGLYYS